MRFDAANGWQFFVATLLTVIGCINIIQGLVALFVPEFYFATDTEMLMLEYASWGVLLGLWGVVLVVAGMSVLSGSPWARVFAIVLASLNALAQLAFVVAMPLWSMVAIAIDVLVIYGLTAGWPRADESEDEASEREAVYRTGYEAARAAPRPTRSPEDSGGSARHGG
ncbi:hypothetical protein IDM40_09305 [Nocardiopsis sp. HNM0947]|uniref:DUF7144 domain-containing protein n=1 Tax=Nocardiopsis coralli TaxID=2772213 RepID=A0ABR9P4Z2_9ACTN|nr:hypothetical protein [Nocardiopsis coralli]MBE2998901.1 hypothetical protein [Nocardiopsis coralli]